jgi:hypothetical protein
VFVERHAKRIATLRSALLERLQAGWKPAETASVLGLLAAAAGH